MEESGFPEADGEEQPASNTVLVTTALPVLIRIAPIASERVPEGACLGSFIDDRLVARCAIPADSVQRLLALDLFAAPVPLALLAVEQPPGLQCRLCAIVPAALLSDEKGQDAEPWRTSVPNYEASVAGAAGASGETGDDVDEDGDMVAVLLGNIVRFTVDRKHPDDLAREAADVLQKIVTGGRLRDADSRAVDDLLDSI